MKFFYFDFYGFDLIVFAEISLNFILLLEKFLLDLGSAISYYYFILLSFINKLCYI